MVSTIPVLGLGLSTFSLYYVSCRCCCGSDLLVVIIHNLEFWFVTSGTWVFN